MSEPLSHFATSGLFETIGTQRSEKSSYGARCNPGIIPPQMQTQKHMSTTTVKTPTGAAIESINLSNLESAKAKAIVIVKDILELQKQEDAQDKIVEANQKDLEKLMASEVTMDLVYGKTMPAALNVTQQAVAKAIETLVKSRQDGVGSRATALGELIVGAKKNIAALQEAMAKKRKELDDLKVEVVNEVDIKS